MQIFAEFSSWKKIFHGKDPRNEGNVLRYLADSVTFANDIDSLHFYVANEEVRLAVVHSLPLRPEISRQQKKETKFPSSKDLKALRPEIEKKID
jgi:hypothetical protein